MITRSLFAREVTRQGPRDHAVGDPATVCGWAPPHRRRPAFGRRGTGLVDPCRIPSRAAGARATTPVKADLKPEETGLAIAHHTGPCPAQARPRETTST